MSDAAPGILDDSAVHPDVVADVFIVYPETGNEMLGSESLSEGPHLIVLEATPLNHLGPQAVFGMSPSTYAKWFITRHEWQLKSALSKPGKVELKGEPILRRPHFRSMDLRIGVSSDLDIVVQ